jgi:hypothetical protein
MYTFTRNFCSGHVSSGPGDPFGIIPLIRHCATERYRRPMDGELREGFPSYASNSEENTKAERSVTGLARSPAFIFDYVKHERYPCSEQV